VNSPQYQLYRQTDGTCVLKLGRESPICFTDLIQALDYVRALPRTEEEEIIVYDILGNVAAKVPI
jgi:hypothetical protein